MRNMIKINNNIYGMVDIYIHYCVRLLLVMNYLLVSYYSVYLLSASSSIAYFLTNASSISFYLFSIAIYIILILKLSLITSLNFYNSF